MKKFVVYKHTCPNEKVYIGITSQSPKHRWNNGEGYKYNIYFYRAIQKYGWDNIKHEILFSDLDKKEAERIESELILSYKSNDKRHGYNLIIETDGVLFHSSETIEKMRIAKLGKKASEDTKLKMSESHKGHIVSETTKEKISNAKKGKKHPSHSQEWKEAMSIRFSGESNPNYGKKMTEEQKRKISENTKGKRKIKSVSLKDGSIRIYDSIKQAERETGAYVQNIIACCKNKKKSSKGFMWSYLS